MSFVWNSNSRHSAVRSLYCQSFYSTARLLCLPACIPRLNALQCSRAGQLLPSPQALCLCVLSALLCCQTRRLVIQSGWRGVVLQIRPCAEGAPSQRRSICWLRLASRLSTQDIFFSPTSRPPLPAPRTPFLLSLFALPQTRPILVPPSTIRITYSFSSSPLSLHCFSFCFHPAIFNKCSVKFRFYLALGAADINECSLYLLPLESIISFLYSGIQKTQEWNCWACSHPWPPSVYYRQPFLPKWLLSMLRLCVRG